MKALYLILLLALVAWKGYHAWLRGYRQYLKDCEKYQSLREYLLGNGATEAEVRRPFMKRAFQKACRPLLRQWRLWALVVLAGLLIWIIF